MSIDWGDPLIKRYKKAFELGYGRHTKPSLKSIELHTYIQQRMVNRMKAETRHHYSKNILWRLLNPLPVNWYAG